MRELIVERDELFARPVHEACRSDPFSVVAGGMTSAARLGRKSSTPPYPTSLVLRRRELCH
jgi:hypothetical protein